MNATGRKPAARTRAARPTVLKLGGELLEEPTRLARLARTIGRLAEAAPLVVVHGGGREIDRALARAGIGKVQVDGLRVTNPDTLDVVVDVVAGGVNTRLVAALNGTGARAVGLTAADATMGPTRRARQHRAVSGRLVDLGRVGVPMGRGTPGLLETLLEAGYLPVVACIGATSRGELLNVNADTLAAGLAGRLGAARLVMAGGTRGVLDADGHTIPALNRRAVAALVRAGTASAGMVAKLAAGAAARAAGVADVAIASGLDLDTLAGAAAGRIDDVTSVTRLV